MRAEGDQFRRFVYPRTLDNVVAPAAGPRWWRSKWLAPVPMLAAAAAIALIARPRAPAEDYVATKGVTLALAVFAGDKTGARALLDGNSLPATAALRFRVQPSAPCHLFILSLDATGEVSRLFPAEGDSGAWVTGLSPLPGGALLDGRPGPERVFAVCTRQALPFEAVGNRVRAAGHGPDAVRATKVLDGLPDGSSQATLLLEKTP